MSMAESTSNRLRDTIKGAGLKQKDLAAALSVSEATVSKILNGQRDISMTTARSIVKVLRHRTGRRRGISLDALFGEAA